MRWGDVTDRVNLTPVAIRKATSFADTVFGNKALDLQSRADPDRRSSPTPEIGTVGLPEHVACERYSQLDIYRARFRPPQEHGVGPRRVS